MSKRIEDLSDEEVANMTPEQFAALEGDTSADTGEDDPVDPEVPEVSDAPKNQAAEVKETEHVDTKVDPDSEEDDGGEAGKGVDAPAGKDKAAETDKTKPEGEVKQPVEVKTTTPSFEDQINALYAPFKANGRDMQVASVDEARQLMQMGANYAKKMSAMKPHLATLRMLENAQISPEQLGFLIDVHKKDAAAINKLVTESGIDPMDLSADKAAGYKPGNHRPSDTEVELEAVIQELDGSAGFDRTLDVVTNKLDPRSKKLVASNPGMLKVINGHIESGIYDLVQAEVERQRMFGQLSGLSDLEAYRQVGDAMNAQKKFDHLTAGQPSQGQPTSTAAAVAAPNPKKAEDESKRKEARRAVAPTKAVASGAKRNEDFNPLAMSDEDFLKQFK